MLPQELAGLLMRGPCKLLAETLLMLLSLIRLEKVHCDFGGDL